MKLPILAVLILIPIFILTQKNLTKPSFKLSAQQSALNYSAKFIKLTDFGLHHMLSSLIWTKTMLDSDTEHYKGDKNSWMYERFNLISELDPYFHQNYSFGTLYLSVIKDDVTGASLLVEKGLQFYPESYHLNYLAGYHFYIEEKDMNKARGYLKKAIELNPNLPYYTKRLYVNTLVDEKLKEQAISFLKNSIEKEDDLNVKKELQDKLKEVLQTP